MGEMTNLFRAQKAYFRTGQTHALRFRIQSLCTLQKAIKQFEPQIMDALHADLQKSQTESYISEIGFSYDEIRFVKNHLHKWMKPKRVPTSWLHFWSTSKIVPEPLGSVLIIGPWNYPFQLIISPLIGAIAAGNCAILKPSECAPHTSHVLKTLITETFDSDYIAVCEGGVEQTQALLAQPFDHLFFTGGTTIGKIVMKAAAEHLTPVTLELGGKSPCIVHKDAPIQLSATRIAWGKYMNAGQTCIAPDYILIHESIKEPFIQALKSATTRFWGTDPLTNPAYGKIINQRHFERLKTYLDQGTLRIGGTFNGQSLAPTVIDEVPDDAPVMQDEIFGPILPIRTYTQLDEAVQFIQNRPKPLALYCFSKQKEVLEAILAQTSSGGVCLNDTLVHISNPHLPFGGVGQSGMGAYHGFKSFEIFTHYKSVLRKTLLFDLPLRYPPYTQKKLGLFKRLMP